MLVQARSNQVVSGERNYGRVRNGGLKTDEDAALEVLLSNTHTCQSGVLVAKGDCAVRTNPNPRRNSLDEAIALDSAKTCSDSCAGSQSKLTRFDRVYIQCPWNHHLRSPFLSLSTKTRPDALSGHVDLVYRSRRGPEASVQLKESPQGRNPRAGKMRGPTGFRVLRNSTEPRAVRTRPSNGRGMSANVVRTPSVYRALRDRHFTRPGCPRYRQDITSWAEFVDKKVQSAAERSCNSPFDRPVLARPMGPDPAMCGPRTSKRKSAVAGAGGETIAMRCGLWDLIATYCGVIGRCLSLNYDMKLNKNAWQESSFSYLNLRKLIINSSNKY